MKKIGLTLFFAVLTFLGNAQDFQTPKVDYSVRDILVNSRKNQKSDTYYLMAISAARKNELDIANNAIAAGLEVNPKNIRLLNLKAALLARRGRLAQARQIFIYVMKISPNDEYATKCLNLIEGAMQARSNKQLTTIVDTKTAYKGKTDAPSAPIKEKAVSTYSPLNAVYFEELKHKQGCAHSMHVIQMAQEKFISSRPKDKADFSLTDLVKNKYLVFIPVCPKSGSYSWQNKEIHCSAHGGFKALEAEVTSVFKEYNSGLRSKLSRNYLDALRSFEQVVILYPLWAEAHYQLADTLFRLGEAEASIGSLRTCLKYDADNLDAQLLMANIYFKKGQKQAALDILDKISSLHKGSIYGMSARSVAKSIRSGRNYYEIFPPN